MISPKDKDQNQDIHPLRIQYVEIKGDAKDEIKDDGKEIAGSIFSLNSQKLFLVLKNKSLVLIFYLFLKETIRWSKLPFTKAETLYLLEEVG